MDASQSVCPAARLALPSLTMKYEDVQAALEGTGLICRGGFVAGPEDAVPGWGGGAATVVVIGNAGSSMWARFSAGVGEDRRREDDNPLNEWTARTMAPIAEKLGARVYFPFDRPYHPFQRWAMKSENIWQSPIGPLIHPEFGLWHAYRAALVFDQAFDTPEPSDAENPCDTCADKPCLSACPVAAFSPGDYDVPACIRHIAAPEGKTCVERHCAARRACPVGVDYRYDQPHAEFHMTKFRRSAAERFGIDIA